MEREEWGRKYVRDVNSPKKEKGEERKRKKKLYTYEWVSDTEGGDGGTDATSTVSSASDEVEDIMTNNSCF